ncbi:hypothetical protein F3Y22_tig00111827pilonHSYRG00034 [Hibiscus syriacus]|uniref:Uncharacterized protein n=1 Tax=Hibiscus syriacus TaxID=106335 RepID=A0A6A2YCK5_HIBSY|nr:hypothetical protein F3Y22_tig00111827pilonHSYRG00034 [Hibiscus syriacus]
MSFDGQQPFGTKSEIKEDDKLMLLSRNSMPQDQISSRKGPKACLQQLHALQIYQHDSNFGPTDVYGMPASRGPTPRLSNFEEDGVSKTRFHYHTPGNVGATHYSALNPIGKSSLLVNFISASAEDISPTIGVDFKIKLLSVGGKRLKLTIWDTGMKLKFK